MDPSGVDLRDEQFSNIINHLSLPIYLLEQSEAPLLPHNEGTVQLVCDVQQAHSFALLLISAVFFFSILLP